MTTSLISPKAYAQWTQILAGETRVPIATTPRQAIYERDGLTLYRYDRAEAARYKTPVLLVYSLVNRPSVLDLLPGRSVVGHLLDAGFDVYLLDWGVPDGLDQFRDLDVYINLLLRTVVREVCRHAGHPTATLLGYCMGGTMAAMYTALHPRRVANLVLLGAPFDFRSEQLLYRWGCDPKKFRPDDVVAACGNAPPWAFDGFSLLRLDQKLPQWADLYDKLDDPKFLESHLAMDAWVNDNIPMAGAIYAEFIKGCFQENRLIAGRMEIDGVPVNLEEIRCPALAIVGDADHLVPPETVLPLADLVPHLEIMRFPGGHVGLSFSRKSAQDLWPKVGAWLARQEETR